MNKKKLMTLTASLAMVAIIGVGATLAYMSSTTATKTNTFTVGKVEATLDEYKDGGTTDWDDATDGKNVYPGQSLIKRPVMTIQANSANSYAFLNVEGADALVAKGFVITTGMEKDGINKDTISAFSGEWTKVSEGNTLDGVYRYNTIITKNEEATILSPIFDLVTYRATQEGGIEGTVGTINITGCAVQADGLEAAEAFQQAKFTK